MDIRAKGLNISSLLAITKEAASRYDDNLILKWWQKEKHPWHFRVELLNRDWMKAGTRLSNLGRQQNSVCRHAIRDWIDIATRTWPTLRVYRGSFTYVGREQFLRDWDKAEDAEFEWGNYFNNVKWKGKCGCVEQALEEQYEIYCVFPRAITHVEYLRVETITDNFKVDLFRGWVGDDSIGRGYRPGWIVGPKDRPAWWKYKIKKQSLATLDNPLAYIERRKK